MTTQCPFMEHSSANKHLLGAYIMPGTIHVNYVFPNSGHNRITFTEIAINLLNLALLTIEGPASCKNCPPSHTVMLKVPKQCLHCTWGKILAFKLGYTMSLLFTAYGATGGTPMLTPKPMLLMRRTQLAVLPKLPVHEGP